MINTRYVIADCKNEVDALGRLSEAIRGNFEGFKPFDCPAEHIKECRKYVNRWISDNYDASGYFHDTDFLVYEVATGEELLVSYKAQSIALFAKMSSLN